MVASKLSYARPSRNNRFLKMSTTLEMFLADRIQMSVTCWSSESLSARISRTGICYKGRQEAGLAQDAELALLATNKQPSR